MSVEATDTLKRWLTEETLIPSTFEISPIKGGGSCEMFLMDTDEARYVLRRAPLASVSSTAHNVMREQRVILALQGSRVRVPEVVAACDDASVFGAPFFIMKYIDGEVIRRKLPPQYIKYPHTQGLIGEELIDALCELHNFKWRGTDIESMASPDNFLGRQVDRWMSQLAGYRQRDLGEIDGIAEWLNAHRPEQGELTVMHGDYKVDNLMYSKSQPPTVLSVVDFEMTTIGDPLIDLAWAMIFWPAEGNNIAIAAPGTEGGMSREFTQSAETLVQRYQHQTGRDLSNFRWYEVFAAFKLAIVLEASYAKHMAGESRNPNHQFFGFVVDELIERANKLLRQS